MPPDPPIRHNGGFPSFLLHSVNFTGTLWIGAICLGPIREILGVTAIRICNAEDIQLHFLHLAADCILALIRNCFPLGNLLFTDHSLVHLLKKGRPGWRLLIHTKSIRLLFGEYAPGL